GGNGAGSAGAEPGSGALQRAGQVDPDHRRDRFVGPSCRPGAGRRGSAADTGRRQLGRSGRAGQRRRHRRRRRRDLPAGQPGRCPADGRGGPGPTWPFGRSVGGLGQQPCGAHYRDGRRGLRRCDGRERAGCLAGVSGGRTGAARAGSGRQRGAGVVRSRRVGQCRRLQRVLPVEGGHRSVGQDLGGRMGRSRYSGERAGADGVSVRGDRVDVHRRSEGPGHPGGDARPDPVAPLRRTGRLRRRPDLSAQRRLELLHRPGDVSGRRVHRML
ncbi:putative oxidoreductase, partial [Mycobacterium canettii CIPT 140010059]